MKKNIIILVSVILGLILLRYGFSAIMQFKMAQSMSKMTAPPVTVEEVKTDSVRVKVPSPARVLSEHRVDVVARVSGFLTKSYFKEGDYDHKGQDLFEIEPEQWLYELQQAKASVEDTRAKLIYAEKQLKRTEILVKKDYVSKASYDQLLSERDALKSQLALYRAKLSDAQRNYGYTRVKAPVSGRVGMIETTVGNFVNVSGEKLTTIFSSEPMYVTFPLSAKTYAYFLKVDKNNLKTPRKVELYLSNGDKYEYDGVQDFQDNAIDQSSGSIILRATFKNPDGKLINGDYGSVFIFSNDTIDSPIVPQTAVLENPQGKYVYKVVDNIAKMTFIETGGQSGSNWIVSKGLNAGDKIITGGLQKVTANQPVKVVTKEELAQSENEQKDDKK